MTFIEEAQAKFAELITSELARIATMKQAGVVKDFASMERIIVGVLPGDGIGPIIMAQALRVLAFLAQEEIAAGKLELRPVSGMTIEDRARQGQSLPDDVLQQVKQCDVLLKGPMVTPRPGEEWPNMVSANSLLRRSLDLFAAVRPVAIPEKNIDWTFFRENIEGEYIWGNKGIQVTEDLAVDFKVQTTPGTERIARQAFEFARKNGKTNVTVITKSNIVKLADGNFLQGVREVGKREYPEIDVQDRLVDAMCARMADETFCKGLQVFVLPNLYGDIVTDIAAELQGGLGTAASANIGNRYAMFEAIHGTAPGLISEGRGEYADPCSLIRAVGMLLAHIGYGDKSRKLSQALHRCTVSERKKVVTTWPQDASAAEFTDYLLEVLADLN
ncbi:isocitrate/isopropylmalate family dehydrogenase [Escherichia fergusonii]|uniref:Isocitrate/isopropylmalate dehydrogenase family protein n=1 Tax=Escherichia fergusonii TaxID=564 RepID=A0A7W3ELW6_ESCFE|nr:isocitrate/isopropylmalate family dehydrogenase [Escherichia fergusonii]EFL4495957.1 isocitrate/isopropylmalate dehydrogenase family protein [Escherichia fergusonii]EHG6159487.1 isocitrate/isopropylmalate dehydrogenase family protein [Escherichia fergusonii]EHG6169454.1 isocitrate/isopropylmalate dehydrogenase family protein [Escherichia fergusonii]EHG7566877.1 isocitrate/isopropylmalate dehydrogenase family protein [Escherichia fergusonii]EHJ4140024.1 isocitrate/isopropylmalate dehydrogena